jgi:phospholipid/cholesterol/gamma-HCH transport system permease protein
MSNGNQSRLPGSFGALGAFGKVLFESLTFVGECFLLLKDVVLRLGSKPREGQETLNQMAFVGVASVPIVALTTFSSGAVISLYTAQILIRYSASSLAGGTVGLAVVREIAPVLAGIMVAARCGSAIAASIGTMAVTEQLDALKSLNVPPLNYLVIPRVIACVLMLPVLGLIGMFSGVAGGYLVSVVISGIPDGTFWRSVQQFMSPTDLYGGLIKTLVFGLIVAVVSCQQGLRTRGGAVGVGSTTTRTVVLTMVLIYVANYFLTTWLFA